MSWKGESQRHSLARKGVKTGNSREKKKGIISRIISKIEEKKARKEKIKEIKVGDIVTYKSDLFDKMVGAPSVQKGKVSKIERDFAGTVFWVEQPFRQFSPKTGKSRIIKGQETIAAIYDDRILDYQRK